jgi:ABC-type transport system substrate-binding protein
MFSSRSSKLKHAISRGATIGIVVVVIIIIAVGAYAAVVLTRTSSTSSSSTTTTTTTTTSSSSTGVPSSLNYYQTNSFQYLDPGISYYEQDYEVITSVYEPLLFYQGNTSTVIPWLAQSFSVSPSGTTANLTLRQGIKFQDGEQFNSTAVYFTLYRLLIGDSCSPISCGTQASWVMQQLVANHAKLGYFYGGSPNNTQAYVNAWLASDFVQITGQYSVTLHIAYPNAALPYLLAGDWASMLAPGWVMSHDVALWSGSSPEGGYTALPYKTLSGNSTQMINQYLYDLGSTYTAGPTPKGIGYTSLIGNTADLASGTNYAPLAGTGPYEITSWDFTTQAMTLTKNSNYWGGPSGTNGAHITTINYIYQTSQATRETSLLADAKAGRAAAMDITTTNLYDVADRATWAGGAGTLVPNTQWKGLVFFAGVVPTLSNYYYGFSMNTTNPLTGTLNKFQPFADQRIRHAFAVALNMSEINADYNNGVGTLLNSVYAIGLPPTGSYNSSMPSDTTYNPDLAAQLLLSAMASPITSFTFVNGTAAPSGYFSTAFGCTTTPPCASPIKQSIVMTVPAGDPTDLAAFEQIETTIGNISSTYNMGLSVSVQVLPTGQLYSNQFSGYLSLNWEGWIADYPWVTDFMAPAMVVGGSFTVGAGINNTYLNSLYGRAVTDTSTNNLTDLVKTANLAAQFTNQQYYYIDAYTTKNLNNVVWTTAINPASVLNNPILGYVQWALLY